MYVRVFTSLLDSTVWCESSDARCVWMTLMLMADREGFVFMTVPGLARRAIVPLEATEAALAKFLAPDPYSSDRQRDPESDGRRLESVSSGWRILNYVFYRNLLDAEARRQATRARVKRHRNKKGGKRNAKSPDGNAKSVTGNGGVTPGNAISDAYSSSEADADKNKKNTPELPPASMRSWRGLGPAGTTAMRRLDELLRKRDAALALPDKLGEEQTIAVNRALVDQDPARVVAALDWAFSDPFWHSQITDGFGLAKHLRKILSGSVERKAGVGPKWSPHDEAIFRANTLDDWRASVARAALELKRENFPDAAAYGLALRRLASKRGYGWEMDPPPPTDSAGPYPWKGQR